ncbi:MAG: hypothetical protein PVS2B2_15090 [Candidatus Acidiferrum sp.]
MGKLGFDVSSFSPASDNSVFHSWEETQAAPRLCAISIRSYLVNGQTRDCTYGSILEYPQNL